MELIDSHAHLEAPEFDADRALVIDRAKAAGVNTIITVGSGYGASSAARAVDIAAQFPGVYAAVGLHPNDASLPLDPSFLVPLLAHPKVVAVGETGLDFYRDHAAPQAQDQWFRAQIRLALAAGKPLIIHSRQAGEDCLRILKEEGAEKAGGVFHCFAENAEFAKRLEDMNFIISVPGNVTYKKADLLKETVKALPLSRIMLETDSPFLAPQKWRGSRCESAFIAETARMISVLKDVSVEEVAEQTTRNARKLFKLPATED